MNWNGRALLLGVVAACLAVIAGAGPAHAATLKTNVSGVRIGGIEASGRISQTIPALTYQGEFLGSRTRAVCEVTRRGTLRTGLVPVAVSPVGALTRLGAITEARINRCASGGVTLLVETLPWDLAWQTGTSGVLLEGTTATGVVGVLLNYSVRFRFEVGVECLVARATLPFLYDNRAGIEYGGTAIRNSSRCGEFGTVEVIGTGRVTPVELTVTALLA